jgi:hypothetical protein
VGVPNAPGTRQRSAAQHSTAHLLCEGEGVAEQHVDLVEHDGAALVEAQVAGLDVLGQAAGRGHDQVHALVQRLLLRPPPEATCKGEHTVSGPGHEPEQSTRISSTCVLAYAT